jgi:hypothetical protein
MTELTKTEIERQDFVDNSIFDLIKILNPTEKEIQWNIEIIGEIRDVIFDWLVDNLYFCAEKEFYPYIEHKENRI